jgi:hypothetical protein
VYLPKFVQKTFSVFVRVLIGVEITSVQGELMPQYVVYTLVYPSNLRSAVWLASRLPWRVVLRRSGEKGVVIFPVSRPTACEGRKYDKDLSVNEIPQISFRVVCEIPTLTHSRTAKKKIYIKKSKDIKKIDTFNN